MKARQTFCPMCLEPARHVINSDDIHVVERFSNHDNQFGLPCKFSGAPCRPGTAYGILPVVDRHIFHQTTTFNRVQYHALGDIKVVFPVDKPHMMVYQGDKVIYIEGEWRTIYQALALALETLKEIA
jgi:hypothetical protein